MEFRSDEKLYREAGAMYQQGRHREALEILDGLSRKYPDTAHLMYARARCLAKMQRIPDAVAVCDALIRQFDHPRAMALKERLVTSVSCSLATPVPFSGAGGAESDFDVQVVAAPFRTPPPKSRGPAADGIRWHTALLLVFATAGVAMALGFAWARGCLSFP